LDRTVGKDGKARTVNRKPRKTSSQKETKKLKEDLREKDRAAAESDAPEPAMTAAPMTNGKAKGVGIDLAYDAINHLKRIPQNDVSRALAFQMVLDFAESQDPHIDLHNQFPGPITTTTKALALVKSCIEILKHAEVGRETTRALEGLHHLSVWLKDRAQGAGSGGGKGKGDDTAHERLIEKWESRIDRLQDENRSLKYDKKRLKGQNTSLRKFCDLVGRRDQDARIKKWLQERAIKHKPDRDGNNEVMEALNEAGDFFLDLLGLTPLRSETSRSS
jgi:hypothetical protein